VKDAILRFRGSRALGYIRLSGGESSEGRRSRRKSAAVNLPTDEDQTWLAVRLEWPLDPLEAI
jgi:hypothetical protein